LSEVERVTEFTFSVRAGVANSVSGDFSIGALGNTRVTVFLVLRLAGLAIVRSVFAGSTLRITVLASIVLS